MVTTNIAPKYSPGGVTSEVLSPGIHSPVISTADNLPDIFDGLSSTIINEAPLEPLPSNVVQVINDVLNYDRPRVIIENVDRYFRTLPLLINYDFNVTLGNLLKDFKNDF